MKIDITGSDLQAFLGLAQNFPNGTITANGGKAYWEWDGNMQVVNQPMALQPQMQQQPRPQNQNAFLNMFDAMASKF